MIIHFLYSYNAFKLDLYILVIQLQKDIMCKDKNIFIFTIRQLTHYQLMRTGQ